MLAVLVYVCLLVYFTKATHVLWHDALHNHNGLVHLLQGPNHKKTFLNVFFCLFYSINMTKSSAEERVSTEEWNLGVGPEQSILKLSLKKGDFRWKIAGLNS